MGLLTDKLTHKSNHLSGEYKMSIKTFGQTFGQSKTNEASSGERPKAQFWLNIGYTANEGTDEAKFISLPTGIPLDTQEPLSTKSSNDDFRAMRFAQNDLLEQLLAFAKDLEPGAEGILQLQVQLRRVKDDAPAISTDDNKYARKLTF